MVQAALKLENEVETNKNTSNEVQYSEGFNQISEQNISENIPMTSSNEVNNDIQIDEDVKEPSNGLENFGLQEQEEKSFELFENNEAQNTLVDEEKETEEEDELEIPAFLRRQKN